MGFDDWFSSMLLRELHGTHRLQVTRRPLSASQAGVHVSSESFTASR